MAFNKLRYLLHSGKNSKLKFYIRCYIRKMTPAAFFRMHTDNLLDEIEKRSDKEYIHNRANYYNKLTTDNHIDTDKWKKEAIATREQPMTEQTVYYHDSMEIARYFAPDRKWILLPGDITHVPELPTIVKSRPLCENNNNSVLINMDKVRHFLFVNDKTPWREKLNTAIFRGDLGPRKENRNIFMRQFGNGQSTMVDAGSTNDMNEDPYWKKEKLTIADHLKYKFVMSLEGNDVASNLKWVMSSNSIAVMPRPTCETWFMEGSLIPNYHYIEVKEDFSNLEERLNYYIEHPEEAEAIIEHAHEYVSQFKDKKRELLISLLVFKKYFKLTNTDGIQ